MRLQLISILLAATTIFLLPEVGYSETNSTQNLALGYSFEEEIFVDESDVDEKIYYRKVEVGANGNIYAQVQDRKDWLYKVIVFNPNGQFVEMLDRVEIKEVKFDDVKEDCREDYIAMLPDYAKENLKRNFGWSISDCERDKDGNIYFCFFSPGRILKYNAKGEKVFEIFVIIAEKYMGPVDLEVDDFGNIIVANTSFNALDIYDKNGRFLYSYEGNFVREEADGISGLQDIALDEQRNVYAVDRYANQIKKLTLIKRETSYQQKPEDETRELIEKLKEGSRDEIDYAIKRLNRATDSMAIKALINIFAKPEGYRGDPTLSLSSIGKPAIPFLIEALESPSREVKSGVLQVLDLILELNSDQSVVIPILNFLMKPPLEDQFGQPISGKEIAISILGKARDSRSVPVLINIMKRNPSYRLIAAEALGLIGDKTAIPDLIEMLNLVSESDTLGGPTATFIRALGRLKAKEAVDVIIELGLKSENYYLRQHAINALVEIGDSKAISALQKALETESYEYIKVAISEAIQELERKKEP